MLQANEAPEAEPTMKSPHTPDEALHDAEGSGFAKTAIQLVISALILLAGGGLCYVLYLQKTAPAKTDLLTSEPIVEVVAAAVGDLPVTINGYGTVRARDRVQLVPQVDGRIVSTNVNFAEGGTLRGGEVVATLDAEDAELAVQRSQAELDRLAASIRRLDARRKQAEANVAAAETRLETQRAEADVARTQFEKLNPDREVPPLVAREPQVREAEAAVAAAEANLEDIGSERDQLEADRAAAETALRQAELNLQRTAITLPGSERDVYRVTGKNAEVGQYVSPGSPIATLYKTSTLEVPVPLKASELRWFDVGEAPATLTANNFRQTWRGTAVRTDGQIDARSRLVNVVIAVDPSDEAALVPGLFLEATIEGRTVENVAAVPRLALRQIERGAIDRPDGSSARRTGGFDVEGPQRLYVVRDGVVRFVEVEVVRRDRETVYVRGLNDGELVVTTDLKVVTDGMRVDVAGEAAPTRRPTTLP